MPLVITITKNLPRRQIRDTNNPQFPGDLVTYTEEVLNGKLHFLFSEIAVCGGSH